MGFAVWEFGLSFRRKTHDVNIWWGLEGLWVLGGFTVKGLSSIGVDTSRQKMVSMVSEKILGSTLYSFVGYFFLGENTTFGLAGVAGAHAKFRYFCLKAGVLLRKYYSLITPVLGSQYSEKY